MVQLIPRADFDGARFRAEDARLGHDYEYNMMSGTPYVMRRRILLGPSGLPCSPPPWGSLVAVDLKTGAKLWETPLGSFTRPLGPEMTSRIKEEWGSPNLGGPIATAGGVVFIGAALDRWFRAYDIETGRELWRGPLPESGRATPMSYQLRSGEQFVAIAVGGGDVFRNGRLLGGVPLALTLDAMIDRPNQAEFAPFYAAYVSLVPEADIIQVLEEQAADVRERTRAFIPAREGFRYAEGKWSVREVLGHVTDAERVFGFRAFCFSRGDENPLPGFDENDYVARSGFDRCSLADLVQEFGQLTGGEPHRSPPAGRRCVAAHGNGERQVRVCARPRLHHGRSRQASSSYPGHTLRRDLMTPGASRACVQRSSRGRSSAFLAYHDGRTPSVAQPPSRPN